MDSDILSHDHTEARRNQFYVGRLDAIDQIEVVVKRLGNRLQV